MNLFKLPSFPLETVLVLKLLQSIFITFTIANDLYLVEIPRERSQHKGYALVEFEDEEDAEHAIFNMNNSEFFGKNRTKIITLYSNKTN